MLSRTGKNPFAASREKTPDVRSFLRLLTKVRLIL